MTRKRFLLVLGLAASLALCTLFFRAPAPAPDVYRIHVTVLGPDGLPVADARVWSARGGDGRKVAGGWEIELPVSLRPADGRLTVFAVRQADQLQGAVTVPLTAARAVRGTIHMAQGR